MWYTHYDLQDALSAVRGRVVVVVVLFSMTRFERAGRRMFGRDSLWKRFSWTREATLLVGVVAEDGPAVRPRGLPRGLDDALSTACRRRGDVYRLHLFRWWNEAAWHTYLSHRHTTTTLFNNNNAHFSIPWSSTHPKTTSHGSQVPRSVIKVHSHLPPSNCS